MASRWANWSTGTEEKGLSLNGFLTEQTATEEAHGMGLHSVGYGWWADKSGQVVARSRNGRLEMIEGDGETGPTTAATTDMGNPTGTASGITPADKARSMGLQSNGSGGYVDQEGNTVARTVNNELVFYDSRASGGAVSDGSAGAQLTQSQPSWVDPVTGLIITPPAQPESPEEIDATPDPVPALAPAGFDAIMNRMKRKAYEDRAAQTEVENEVAGLQAEVDEKYASNEGAMAWKQSMDEKIDKAIGGGDEYKAEISANTKDYMNDNAEELIGYYDLVEPEKWQELSTLLTKKTIADQKSQWFETNVKEPIDNDESMSEEEKREALLLAYDDLQTGIVGFGNLPYYEKDINELVNPPEQEIEGGEPIQIDGELTNFELGPLQTEKDEFDKLSGTDITKIKQAANKTAKKNGVKTSGVRSVEWGSNEGSDSETSEGRRATALDALKTWRGSVLPELTPGTVLVNRPIEGGRGGNQRERIYSLAGFGDYSAELFGQYGLVIQDENGDNKVVPIDYQEPSNKKKKSRKLKEEMIRVIDYKLDEESINFIYENLIQ